MWKLTPKEQRILLLLGCLLVIGVFLVYILPGQDIFAQDKGNYAIQIVSEGKDLSLAVQADISVKKFIQVHVTGAVTSAGVYLLEEGSRAHQAVEKAGGYLEDADLERINLAQPLFDGQQIFVPRKSDAGFIAGSGANPDLPGGKININTATKSDFETLPGIGPARADRIIKYRQEKGYFYSVDDLLNISGIGAKTLDGFRELITVY